MIRKFFLERFLKSAAAIGLVLLFVMPARASTANNPLKLFKRYFGYNLFIKSEGKGVRGSGQPDVGGKLLATTTIQVTIPANAKVHSAFLYWETLEKTAQPSSAVAYVKDPGIGSPPPCPYFPSDTTHPSTDCTGPSPNGSLQYPATVYGKPLPTDQGARCSSAGGSTGDSNGSAIIRVYRADVLRYLPLDSNQSKIPTIKVGVSDSGSNGGGAPLTEGVSLVVVYEDTSLPANQSSFRTAIIYDGSVTLNNATDEIVQKIGGIDQASAGSNNYIGYIVGDGQQFPEIVSIGPSANNFTTTIPSPFSGTDGPFWDDMRFNLSSNELPTNAASVTTKIGHGQGSFDCLSFSAIYVGADVVDVDADGLVDYWETPLDKPEGNDTKHGFRDPQTGKLLLNLAALGAHPNHKDLFLESDFMVDTGHSHSLQAKSDALKLVGDALKFAPVNNPDNSTGIDLHVDLGPYTGTNPYILKSLNNPPLGYKLEGGDSVSERLRMFYCTEPPATKCSFKDQPGLIVWKVYLLMIQQAYAPGIAAATCQANPQLKVTDPDIYSSQCRTYFNDYRGFMFHYLFAGHSQARIDPVTPGVASTASGRADLPGRNFIATVGGWKFSNPGDQGVGDVITLAGVILHELAHNWGGLHEGFPGNQNLLPPTDPQYFPSKENCNPGNIGVLNYRYQRGVTVGPVNPFGLNDGALTVDLSRGVFNAPYPAEDETHLNETAGLGLGNIPYRLAWFAPRDNVATRLGISANLLAPAKRHCADGSLADYSPGKETPLVRVVGAKVDPITKLLLRSPVDWDYNGKIGDPANPAVDINFNGKQDLADSDPAKDPFALPADERYNGDWAYIERTHGLQRIGLGRNIRGLSLDVVGDDLLRLDDNTDTNSQDLTPHDAGLLDGDSGLLDGDSGLLDGDSGLLDGDSGLLDGDGGEPDFFDNADGAPTGLNGTRSKTSIDLNWQVPLPDPDVSGTLIRYRVLRSEGTELVAPLTTFVPQNPTDTSFSDGSEVGSKIYTYGVVAEYSTNGGTTITSIGGPVSIVTFQPFNK